MLDYQAKHISFGPSNEIILVERIEGAWYTRREIALIRRRDHEILKKVRRGEFKEGIYDSARGLARDVFFKSAKPAVRAVLQEQKRQQDAGISNVDKLAELSCEYTKTDRVIANENAFKDAINANETRRNALSQISTFKLIAAHEKRPQFGSTFVQQETPSRNLQKDFRPSRSDVAVKLDTNVLFKSRQRNKPPSLRKAFSKTLINENVFPEYIHWPVQLQVAPSSHVASVDARVLKRQVFDREDTTDLTLGTSFSSIESF